MSLKKQVKITVKQKLPPQPTITPIMLSLSTFTHIIHLSDLHIRPIERHTEYKHVFNNLYISLTTLKSTIPQAIIIITGDIFDNKNRFLPEQYELCNEFFTRLSTIYPLLVICGNHDIKDITRLDSITPSAYPRPNFHYLLNSGAYQYGQVVFTVSSLYDSNQIISRSQINTQNLCIALYHGTITGSTNDEGYTFSNTESNRLCTKNDFKNYDAVLLGDIHKMQSITKTIWYPGSLIQQNHGESLHNHGYLLWSIANPKNITVTFHEVSNDYGMVTIIIKNNIWTNNTIPFPQKTTIRCDTYNTITTKVEEIIDLIKTRTEVLEYNTICNDEIICNNTNTTDPTAKPKDIILEELKLMDLPNTDDIVTLHNNYMSKLDNTLSTNIGYTWYPLTLKFTNLFGYSGNHTNTINFKTGVTSITAPNATGKTSIVNILLFAIFNDLLYKGTQNIDILNNTEKVGNVQLSISRGNVTYTIVKDIIRQKSKTIPVVVKTQLKYNDTVLNNDIALFKMKELFGNIDDFHKCNILNSKDQMNDFFNLTNANKIKYLKEVFKLNYFDELTALNKVNYEQYDKEFNIKSGGIKMLTQELNTLTNDDTLATLDIEKAIETMNTEKTNFETMITTLSTKYDSLQKIVTLKESQIKHVPKKLVTVQKEIEAIEDMYENYDNVYDINELNTQIEINKSKLVNTKDTKVMLLKELNKLTKEKELKNVSIEGTKEEIYKKICEYEMKIKNVDNEIKTLTNQLKKYMNFDKNTKVIKTEDDLLKEIDILQKEYKPTQDITEVNITTRITQIKKTLLKYKNCSTIVNLVQIISSKASLQKELEMLTKQIQKITKELNQYDIPNKPEDNTIKISTLRMSSLYPVPKRINIDMNNYKNNVCELEQCITKIGELQQKTLTDEIINKYVNQIDILIKKSKITQLEFDNMKTSLLSPIKGILQEFKNNTTDEFRNELNELNERKRELTDELAKDENIITQNKKRMEIINCNKKIEASNKLIGEQINNCKYYEKYHGLELLEEQKDDINKNVVEMNNNYEFNKLTNELKELELNLEHMKHNEIIDERINMSKMLINKIKFTDITSKIKGCNDKLPEYNEMLHKYNEQYMLIEIAEMEKTINNKLKIIRGNNLITKKIEELNDLYKYETERQKLIKCKEDMDIILNNNIFKKEINKLKEDIDKICVERNNKNNGLQYVNRNMILYMDKIKRINELNEKLMVNKKEIEHIEMKRKEYYEYGKLISPQVLQVKVIRKELKKLEVTMNEILSKYTKYNVRIMYDTSKNIQININSSGNPIKTHLLSNYENLILLTAFKRAIGKHTNSTKSKLYLIDESVENMDEDNFQKSLPVLLKQIGTEYSYILLISQRDIKHAISNEVRICKRDGVSQIV